MRYIVESVLLPLEAGQTCRELRVAGETITCGALLDILGNVQGVKYATTYLDPAEAEVKEEAARVAGDVDAELLWAGKALLSVGFVPGPYDNARFSFTAETVQETFWRLFGTH
jgi:hypothetical protein